MFLGVILSLIIALILFAPEGLLTHSAFINDIIPTGLISGILSSTKIISAFITSSICCFISLPFCNVPTILKSFDILIPFIVFTKKLWSSSIIKIVNIFSPPPIPLSHLNKCILKQF